MNTELGKTILRFGLGILFFFAGIIKIMNMEDTVKMVSNVGFPAAAFFAWLLLLTEIVFGVMLLIGWKVQYTTIPLIVVIVIAILTVTRNDPMQLLKDLSILASLVGLMLMGPGKWTISKE